ncbi:glutamate synthase-related protein [Ammoniphilus sp. CFH 90114]|uniref:glutamate synthase-related protein n=1 Tax=Ammoniphilus sp. CFH 90114 TaxID=2493665 RepID=UPI00100E9825|nr:glutamate synthase-related protein [Ammoniphilus sp. CFH 90114]RXT04835.1 glutamate synthase [Ammoniphilus sp. CFH 90114]
MRVSPNYGKFKNHLAQEHDSCGIVAIVEKNGQPTRDNVLRIIDALIKMEHRSGFIDGEGDGCGILTDIPRDLWAQKLTAAGHSSSLAYDEKFSVAHIFVPRKGHDPVQVMNAIRDLFAKYNVTILLEQENAVNSEVLGKNGRADEPIFWQVASLCENEGVKVESNLFDLHIEIEDLFHVHVASLSNYTAAYKVMGAASIIPRYYQDITKPEFASSATLGHNRYSTNTLSSFFRVQPFSVLGHNGEINTINKLEDEASMLGVPLVKGGSDSQNMNRTIETLIHRYGLSLFEALEMVFPPIHNEIKHLRPELRDLYMYFRQTWGHFAQGPAGIISRYKDECVFSVDALGLRPVWMVEDTTSLFFSSEQGVTPVTEMVSEPKSLAPGEKVGLILHKDAHVEVIYHGQLQETVYERAISKGTFTGFGDQLTFAKLDKAKAPYVDVTEVSNQIYSAFGWEREQIQLAEQMATNGAEPIRSLGHDAPLAALAQDRQNLADFIKESVAVVTNPAIDRDREMEHFSTRVVLGARPGVYRELSQPGIELPAPIILEGANLQEAAAQVGSSSLEQILEYFSAHGGVATLSTHFTDNQKMTDALEQLAEKAVQAAQSGSQIILLDDALTHTDGKYWIDPLLTVAKVDQALKSTKNDEGISLRRKTSIILRSAAIRSLHDIAVAFGIGADAIDPYLLFSTVYGKDGSDSVISLYEALCKGLEKVTSTIGIHEARGYFRIFSSIGLNDSVAEVLHIVNFCGSEKAGTSFEDLENDSKQRYEDFQSAESKPAKLFHLWPRVWKSIGQLASGTLTYQEFADKLEEIEKQTPLSIRHVADINYEKSQGKVDPSEVNIGVGDHSLPFVISSMSFGSQNEIAFRAYAEAADQLNMISLNGEGGEIKDMIGKYPKTRGQQIASGRFGVNVELANSSNLLELKIGQGAKPGEGGHLPGKKVTAKVAAARNATIGSDLISPSNNHDIYSIEDLAQIIDEFKTANHQAKVIVKVPVVPNIGTIAVGVAKAGADIITLSGFDGGTGAARIHALQHVGLPTEIGVAAAHKALIEAGLRNKVELWSDGGLKSGNDVVKMMMLGANRAGFGTLAMLAVGCTTCRGCHLDTCHVGIATQIESVEEAKEHGLRRFVPRVYDEAVENLKRLFTAFGEEVKRITAELGISNTQELVGRSDLLQQVRETQKIDLSAMLDRLDLEPALLPAVHEEAELAKVLVAAGAENQSAEPVYVDTNSPLVRQFTNVLGDQRVLGSRYSGERVKPHLDGSYVSLPEVHLNFESGCVPGNGLGAFNAEGINIRVQGGAQDGVGKTSFGGKISVMKARNKNGLFINGSVGKSFAYGAQKGTFIVQGNADARACIRLSGADIIFGGELTQPINDQFGGIGGRANLKGFAFEYMTNGRAIVMGDPGPWICAGMTGGVVYIRLQPEMGLDEAAINRRIAKGAKVSLLPLSDKGQSDVVELLNKYIDELKATDQAETAARIEALRDHAGQHFMMLAPVKLQADQSVATE